MTVIISFFFFPTIYFFPSTFSCSKFNLLSLEKRQNIANSCYSKMSKEKYFKKLEFILESTIVKYKKYPKGKLEFVS